MLNIYKNFLDWKDWKHISKAIMEEGWTLGHTSTGSITESCFWKRQVHKEQHPYFYNELLDKIKQVTGKDFEIERIYFNGHNACGSGKIHQDDTELNSRTFLIYCNEVWSPELGGSTIFINSKEDIVSVYPHPGSAVFFDGKIPHCAQPISKDFNGIRITLAFKLFEI